MSETHPRNWTLGESIAHLDAEHWNKPCTWADAVPADAQCARCGELFDGTESFEAHFEAGEREARKARKARKAREEGSR